MAIGITVAVDGSVDQMMMLRWLWRHSVVAYRSAICARSRAAARATQSAAGPGLSAAAAAPTMASTGSVAIWYRRNGSNKSACVHFDKKTIFCGLPQLPTNKACLRRSEHRARLLHSSRRCCFSFSTSTIQRSSNLGLQPP